MQNSLKTQNLVIVFKDHLNNYLMRAVIGISGASGAIYGVKLIDVLNKKGIDVYTIITKNGLEILRSECGENIISKLKISSKGFYHEEEWSAPMASSSWVFDFMIIAPCSVKTLAAISHGLSINLLIRAALNAIRMGKKLVLVIRETPLSVFDLENALKVAKVGVTILPASPGFYHNPKDIDDLINFIVGKVLDVLDIDHNLYKRWGED